MEATLMHNHSSMQVHKMLVENAILTFHKWMPMCLDVIEEDADQKMGPLTLRYVVLYSKWIWVAQYLKIHSWGQSVQTRVLSLLIVLPRLCILVLGLACYLLVLHVSATREIWSERVDIINRVSLKVYT